MSNEDFLDQVVKEIFEIDDPKIADKRRDQLQEFIKITVNGDTIEAYLVIQANLRRGKLGVLVYILTNVRLIKIEIDENEITSTPFIRDTISVSRKLKEDSKMAVEVTAQNASFGLSYSAEDKKITEFFQKVDQRVS